MLLDLREAWDGYSSIALAKAGATTKQLTHANAISSALCVEGALGAVRLGTSSSNCVRVQAIENKSEPNITRRVPIRSMSILQYTK